MKHTANYCFPKFFFAKPVAGNALFFKYDQVLSPYVYVSRHRQSTCTYLLFRNSVKVSGTVHCVNLFYLFIVSLFLTCKKLCPDHFIKQSIISFYLGTDAEGKVLSLRSLTPLKEVQKFETKF